MAQDNKKRHIVSLENMSKELAEVFAQKYPKGFSDYLPDIVKYPKPDGTSFYAVLVETEDSIYLVKVKMKVDDLDDIEKWLEGEEEAEVEQVTGAVGTPDGDDNTLPDDNISQYGADDEPSDGPDSSRD